jgi:hypothetical protein
MLKRILSLSRSFLFSPGKAADACKKGSSLAPCMWIYLAFTAAYMLFFTLKPFDFPDRNAALPREPQTLLFWFKVMLWQPPLEAAWIAFLLGLLAWFKNGRMPLRLTGAVAWTALPYVLLGAYAAQDGISKTILLAGFLVWLGLFIPFWRRTARSEALPVAGFMLGINVIGLAVLLPMLLATLLRSSSMFMAAQAAGGFWILGCGTLGLRRLTGLRLPRTFMAVLLSMFFQIAFAFTLHLLGLVPKDILKALLYA